MRVLLANKYFFVKGGAERAFFEMDGALRGAGHETIHFSVRDERNAPSRWSQHFPVEASFEGPAWGAPALRGLGRMFYSREVRARLGALVEQARPDGAVLHNVYHQLGPSVVLELSARGVPTVMVLHDYKVVCPAYTMLRDGAVCRECRGQQFYHAAVHGCGGSRLRGGVLAAESYWQWHGLQSYGRVGGYVAPSQYLIDTLHDMGFPFEIELVRNALRAPEKTVDPAEGVAVGFAGRLSAEKGVEVLLAAAARLPSIPFRLAGVGPLAGWAAAEVARRGLGNVALLGHLDGEDLAREQARWRIAVVPSVWAENCPYAVLEPYALGVPVIGTDLGGLRELLTPDCRVAAGDDRALAAAIESLWGDAARCRALGARGRALVSSECSPEKLVPRLEAALARAAGC